MAGHLTRVVVVDEVPELRSLLRLALDLDGDFDVVAESADVTSAVALAVRHRPDAVVLGVTTPTPDAPKAVAELHAAVPGSRIVVASTFPDDVDGADANLDRGTPASDLVAALRQVCGLPAAEQPKPDVTPDGAAPRQQKREQDVVAALVHELMTPVSVLQGFALTLEKSYDRMPPEVMRSAVGRIARSAGQLQALVDALAQSRDVEVGSIDLDRQPLDLGSLVEEVVADFGTVTKDHDIVVRAADGVTVDGDPTRLRQVVTNLLSNAAKFSPRDTSIRVSVAAGGETAFVGVRDHGAGVPEADRERVFQKYARLDSGVKGLGLGLFISRGIARAHGGELAVDDAPGGGATFVLRLPAG